MRPTLAAAFAGRQRKSDTVGASLIAFSPRNVEGCLPPVRISYDQGDTWTSRPTMRVCPPRWRAQQGAGKIMRCLSKRLHPQKLPHFRYYLILSAIGSISPTR